MNKLILAFIFTIISIFLNAQVITSAGSGNWNTGATWTGGVVPSATDSVVILNSHLITLNMPVSGNNQCKSLYMVNGGVLEYRSSGAAILQLTNVLYIASGAILRTITGSTETGHVLQVGGNLTNIGVLNIRCMKLKLAGNMTGAGTTYADSTIATIEMMGSTNQNISTNFNASTIANIIFNNSATFNANIIFSTSAKFYSGTLTNASLTTFGAGGTTGFVYERKDGTHPTVTRNYGTGTKTFTYSNTGNISIGSELSGTVSGTIIMNSVGIVALSAALTIQKLNMQAGMLITTATNMLTISDTGRYSVTRTGGWVNGPLKRTLPYGMNTVDMTRIYLFPVGKSSYAGFELVTPITANVFTFPTCFPAANCVVQCEAFDGATGGSSPTLSYLKNNRYWNYSVTTKSCAFFSSGIRVYDSTAADTVAMAVSNSKTGGYNNIGGYYENNTLGATQPLFPSLYSNNVFIILGGKPELAGGIYTVGSSGKNYSGITAVSNALHSSIVTGDIIFEFYDNYICNATYEIIPFTFWPFAKRGGNWTAILRPNINNTTTLLTQGSPSDPNAKAYYHSLVTFNGVQGLTIDGRNGGIGSTQSWLFRNTTTSETAPVFRFQNDAIKNTIQYLIIEGQVVNNYGLVDFFNTSYTKGNDSNAVKYNYIRKRTDVPANYSNAIYSYYTSGSAKNDHNTIEGNYIENANYNSIYIGNTAAGDGWIIKGNHIYSNAGANLTTGIELVPGITSKYNKITGNYIGGSSAFATGQMYNAISFTGIKLQIDTSVEQEVSYNNIKGIKCVGSNFYGINVKTGRVLLYGNTIGDLSNDSSIILPSGIEMYGLLIDSITVASVSNNTISGMRSRGNLFGNLCYGIRGFSLKNISIYNNRINKLSIRNYPTNNQIHSMYGLYLTSRLNIITNIRNNQFSDLSIQDTGNATCVLMGLYLNPTFSSIHSITRNKCVNLYNFSRSTSSEITGIYIDNGAFTLSNNQVSIINTGSTSPLIVNGIMDNSSNTLNVKAYYNSIYIGGSVSSGSISSYAYRRNVASNIDLKNNIFYNKRIGGAATHYSVANLVNPPTTGWTATSSMHNLLVSNDTSRIMNWNSTAYGNYGLRTISAGDSTSWIYTSSNLPPDSLFTNSATDLTINHTKSYSYAVNGKGKQISVLTEDYGDSLAARSTVLANGAPDIGCDEISPASNVFPMQMSVSGSHSNGGTEVFQQGGRKIAEIIWGATGTLPTLSRYVYYTGTWPNDTDNGGHGSGKKYMNAYIRIDTSIASAGAGYRYQLKYYYDDALLGKLQTENLAVFCKKQVGVAATWDSILNPVLNTSQNSISSSSKKFTSFSEFTLTENSAYALPVIFTNFQFENGRLRWTVANDQLSEIYRIVYKSSAGDENIYDIQSNRFSGEANYIFNVPNAYSTGCLYIKALSQQNVLDETPVLCSQDRISTEHSAMNIFPNPANEELTIQVGNGDYNYRAELCDISGKLLWSGTNNLQSEAKINTSKLPNGMYILSIYNNNGYFRHKIAVNH